MHYRLSYPGSASNMKQRKLRADVKTVRGSLVLSLSLLHKHLAGDLRLCEGVNNPRRAGGTWLGREIALAEAHRRGRKGLNINHYNYVEKCQRVT